MGFQVDPGITDPECINLSRRLDDRYGQPDMAPSHPNQLTRVDPLGQVRWISSYVVKRQTGQDHETATRNVLAEINAIVGSAPSPPPGPIGPRPPVVPRAPLPAFDRDTTDPETGAPLPVHRTLTAVPPAGPSLRFMRANLWGLTLPGLPFIPGGAGGQAQNRMLTYLDNRYPIEWLDRGIHQYASDGYTHWWRSPPDAFASGQNLDRYVDTCKRIQDGGVPYICHLLRSKDYDGRNPDPRLMAPVLERLIREDVIAMAAPAWEASLFYDSDAFAATIQHDAAILVPDGVVVGIHLQAGYPHFGPDLPPGRSVESARTFWLPAIEVGVKRLFYQYDPAWSAGMMQARGNDVSVRLVGGGHAWGLPETVDWDAFELVGVPLFNNGVDGDGRLATEDTADLKGYEMMATPGPLGPSGYGNGCRYPSGAAF